MKTSLFYGFGRTIGVIEKLTTPSADVDHQYIIINSSMLDAAAAGDIAQGGAYPGI